MAYYGLQRAGPNPSRAPDRHGPSVAADLPWLTLALAVAANNWSLSTP
jgi:hypothetical protein